MSILILNNLAYAACPLDQVIPNAKEEIVMFIPEHNRSTFRTIDYLHVESFSNYVWNDQVILRAIELHAVYRFTAIVALHEYDVERAAKLREYLGIEGQSVVSVSEFRNKYKMKQKLQQNGIPVAPMVLATSGLEISEFIETYDYPIVVKPVDGLASIATYIIRSQEEFYAFLEKRHPGEILVEKFVPGDYFHIDGWVENGEVQLITVSQYNNAPLASGNMTYLGSVMLHPKNELCKRLQEGTRKVLEILDTPLNTTFHAEWFHTPEDQLIFGEIGSRTGGAKVSDAHKLAYDAPLFDIHALISIGLSGPSIPDKVKTNPDQLAGWLVVSTQPGTLRLHVTDLPDWVKVAQITGKDGERYHETILSVDSIAQFAFIGKDEDQIQARFHELIHLANSYFRWELE